MSQMIKTSPVKECIVCKAAEAVLQKMHTLTGHLLCQNSEEQLF